ncbi:GNAT family N-acetyltransferase [Streptacidiphilus fuscans]|uniref:GNAT family N-acetyltransferase n=1 Tax=Streptacidiphilus fuscans TaxID=2789292 RepID=A0A931FI96_9ACTN|nr:GNAT family N-acetyltransferase [Streptacidiphilus fuscans]MBF9071569.1 GNAT family N-acetyltransferase [Streptacidiphilus fuscans]
MDIDVQSFAVAHLRRRPEVVETGRFVIGIDPATTSPYVNYATPLPGAAPTGADVRQLVGAFRERGLLPRLEFAPDAAPAVASALQAAGFAVEARHAYLVCTPDTLPPSERGNPGPKVETPVSDADYLAVAAALAEAFGGESAASPEGTARLRRTQEGGGAVRFVRAPDGSCAGGGQCSAPAAGTAELAGVGTRPAHRGRGVAAAVTEALARAAFVGGAGSVWLEYSGDGSRRVYERVGFRPQGTRLYMSLPTGVNDPR